MDLRRIFFTGLLLLGMNMAPSAYGAELLAKFHPYITVKEEYSDNLNLTSANKKDDFITTVQPGIKFSNMDKMSGVDFDYSLGAVFYAKNSNLNYISHNALLNAKYLTSEHINFYLQESFIRSDEPYEREYFTTTGDNRYVLAVNTERAIYWRNVLAPTIEYKFGAENSAGIKYRNNIYQTESLTGQNSQEDYINPFFNYWFYINRFSAKSSAFADYTYTKRSFASPSNADYDINAPDVGIKFAITPTLNASIQVGYFWMEPKIGSGESGFSYKGELTGIDSRTTYNISLQGGYTEDYFTFENLGFNKYHRLTGSIMHQLEKRTSLGILGSVERVDFISSDRSDTTWGISGTASYLPLKWLTVSLVVSHKELQSNVKAIEYAENRGILSITATY
jgi:hypothetical protein